MSVKRKASGFWRRRRFGTALKADSTIQMLRLSSFRLCSTLCEFTKEAEMSLATNRETRNWGSVDWSLAMIVRDAEAQIGQVLDDAAAVCDELVVVDTGSTDDTKMVAADHGAKVFDFEWIDDFSAARNYSFEQCTGQWILWLDADDRIPLGAQQELSD